LRGFGGFFGSKKTWDARVPTGTLVLAKTVHVEEKHVPSQDPVNS